MVQRDFRPLERLEAISDGKEAGPNSFVVSLRIHRKFVKKRHRMFKLEILMCFNRVLEGVYFRAGSRHGQGWAKPTQMTVLPTQSKLDKDCIIFFVQ